MRGRGKKPKRNIVASTRIPGEQTDAREAVERKWFRRIERVESMAALVTAHDARREPFHRWMVFKQAFSPELVRIFLREAGKFPEDFLLDPFSGTGTFVTECARHGVAAIGIEALHAPAFVAAAKSHRGLPEVPDVSTCETWREIADKLDHPLHRAGLICAVAQHTTARGTLDRNAPPMTRSFVEAIEQMRDDLRNPLPRANLVIRGDGRELACLADASIGGVLTSPPYLSRHDYSRITQPAEEIFGYWYSRDEPHSLPAHPRAKANGPSKDSHEAVSEACIAFRIIRQNKSAKVTSAYFEGMSKLLRSLRRVLRNGSPCWIVLGGARMKDVYIPSDTIVADLAERMDFAVERLIAVRNIVPSSRKFGRLANVAPRESILMLRRS